MSIKQYDTIGEMPHSCPVCGEFYVPAKSSTRLETTGERHEVSLGCVCLKVTPSWSRAYAHTEKAEVSDGE